MAYWLRSLAIAALILSATSLQADDKTTPAEIIAQYDAATQAVTVNEGSSPILRFNHGPTDVPKGIDPIFRRGDYIHPLWGLNGEVLTDDYPADHPHHRAVNWSWATIRWNGEDRDLFAVRGIWARPEGAPETSNGPDSVRISEHSRWMWDDKTPVVDERVDMRVFRKTDSGRFIDFEICLTALVDNLEFCGRLEAGYSGFNVRMAPANGQKIVLQTDPSETVPRRAWGDYSAEFSGGKGRSGLAILQHASNPAYPGEWREYPPLNFFQPVYPGGALIPMPKGQPITLKYRLWIHSGPVDEPALAAAWDKYSLGEGKSE